MALDPDDNFSNPASRCLQHFDDANPNKAVIFVVDNGKGMSSHQLNNWAIYRLSKFNRREQKGIGWVVNTSP